MNHSFVRLLAWICCALALGPGVAHSLAAEGKGSSSSSASSLPAPIISFINAKEKQARELAKTIEVKVSPDIWAYFKVARQDDWLEATNLFAALRRRSPEDEGAENNPTCNTVVWQPVLEVELVLEQFALMEPVYAQLFGEEIVKAVAPKAIYFGGTDPGRGLPTGFSRSHAKGDPFHTITQNALADGTYLDYLSGMYGKDIYTPSKDDSQRTFQEYLTDAQKRFKDGKLRPGEDVRAIEGRVQVSGHAAVMAINALLAKIIFDKNPGREFFIEESFSLDWMYPHLSPHGPILKLHREPLQEMTGETLRRDREYWNRQLTRMVGGWLTPETSVNELGTFLKKVHAMKDLTGFKGDVKFVQSEGAGKPFSKLRSSIGGLYHWRSRNVGTPDEKARMLKEADFAFRQALVLCPTSPEAIFRYVNLLVEQKRIPDAITVAQSALAIDSGNDQIRNLLKELDRMK